MNEFSNEMIDLSMSWANIDMLETQIDGWLLHTLMVVWPFMNILSIVFYLLYAWWLYMMSKKLWVKYARLSFIPIAQIYNLFAISKKSILHYLIFPIIAMIVWGILAIFTFWLTLIAAYIYLIVMTVKLYHAISLRCWRWARTTVWFLLVWFIMFPVVWYNMEDKSGENKNNDDESNIITEENNESKQEIENKDTEVNKEL